MSGGSPSDKKKFMLQKVNKQLKYTLNPILKVFLLSNWAHILRGWIFLRPGFHETPFEAVEAVWNSEVARGRLLVSVLLIKMFKNGQNELDPLKKT